MTTHLTSDGDGLTKCCRRPPFELPTTDRMTYLPAEADCTPTPTDTTGDLFDRYATIVIDADTYQTNPELAALADRLLAAAGMQPSAVTRRGMQVWRDHTIVETFTRTADGAKYVVGLETARRLVRIGGLDNLDGEPRRASVRADDLAALADSLDVIGAARILLHNNPSEDWFVDNALPGALER